jgi:glycosyltransferase involved in cell wall biosynthesis
LNHATLAGISPFRETVDGIEMIDANEPAAPRMTAGNKRCPALLYICDWLPPDFGAVGQYSVIFARELATEGLDVTLAGLSTRGNGDSCEAIGLGRYREIKLATRPYDKTRTLRRLLWTASVNTRLIFSLWSRMRAADTILFTGSPPLFLHWIAPANIILRKKLVYRITDFHPECAIAERGRASMLLRLLYRATLFWRRRVHMFEILGHDQGERLAAIGIPADRMRFKPDPSPVEIGPDTRPLDRPPEADGKLLLLYSGNWGVAHDHMTFVEAYRRHHCEGRANVLLWLNAVGGRAQKVADALTELGLPFIRGTPVPLDRLASLLVTPDAHLITLSDPFVGYVLPSKVFGCVQSGKPVIFIGSDRSDVHRICLESGDPHYRRVDVGDVAATAQALDELGSMQSEPLAQNEVFSRR